MSCSGNRSICIAQIQPRKHVLVDHADYVAPARQQELDPTDQESICPLEDVDHEL